MLGQSQLDRLEALWVEHCDPVRMHVRPGLDEGSIERFTEPVGLRLPHELRTWFAWHDGATDRPDQRDRRLGSHAHYYSLEAALHQYQGQIDTLRHVKETSLDPEFIRLWPANLLPVTGFDHGALLACDCSGDVLAPVYEYEPQIEDSLDEPAFACFGDLVARWIRAYEAGYHVFDADLGRMVPNFDALSPADQRGV